MAAQMSAGDLLQECTAKGDASKLACSFYIEGFMDGVEMASNRTRDICWPKGVSVYQAVLVVVKWLKDHPEDLHNTARLQIMKALMNAFPCKN